MRPYIRIKKASRQFNNQGITVIAKEQISVNMTSDTRLKIMRLEQEQIFHLILYLV